MASRGALVAVSLLAAIAIWSALVASDGSLTRQKTFSNVAVTVAGEATLKSRGFIVMDDLAELVPAVRMTVEVTQANYNRVSGTSYNPHFVLSQIKHEGENELPIAFSSQLYGPVVSCDPQRITVNVERYITRRVPVVLEMTGKMPDGLYLDSYKTDPSTLSISGPQSLVSGVSRVVAKLDQSALTAERMSDRTALDIELQDAKGNVVASDKLEVTNQSVLTGEVIVETEVVPMKDVPLDAESFVTGVPAEGYELTAVELAEYAVPVAARQAALDAIEKLVTDTPLDITGATEDMSGFVRLRRVSGVENTLPTDVGVTARIREKTVERTFNDVPVALEGVDEGRHAVLARSRLTVQLTGGYRFISGLKADDLRLFVDVSGLEDGRHELPVQIHIDNAEAFACALSSPQIAVTLETK